MSAAQPQLLQALLNITQLDADQWFSERADEGVHRTEDFFHSSEARALNIKKKLKDQFVVEREYCTLKASANFNNSYFAMRSVLNVINHKQLLVARRTIGRNSDGGNFIYSTRQCSQ